VRHFPKKNSKKIPSHSYYFFLSKREGGISVGNKKNYFFEMNFFGREMRISIGDVCQDDEF